MREVIELVPVTRIPKTPPFMRAGSSACAATRPVVDLRIKFDLPQVKDAVNTCIIIVDVEIEGEKCHMGAIVDSVLEVLGMASDQITPPPWARPVRSDFIRGMGKQGDEFIMILDIGKVFSPEGSPC